MVEKIYFQNEGFLPDSAKLMVRGVKLIKIYYNYKKAYQ